MIAAGRVSLRSTFTRFKSSCNPSSRYARSSSQWLCQDVSRTQNPSESKILQVGFGSAFCRSNLICGTTRLLITDRSRHVFFSRRAWKFTELPFLSWASCWSASRNKCLANLSMNSEPFARIRWQAPTDKWQQVATMTDTCSLTGCPALTEYYGYVKVSASDYDVAIAFPARWVPWVRFH